jgi:hypothetical protein
VVEIVDTESVEFTRELDAFRVETCSVEVFAVLTVIVLKTAVLPVNALFTVSVEAFTVDTFDTLPVTVLYVRFCALIVDPLIVLKNIVLPTMLEAVKVESVREGTVIVDAANEDVTIRVVVIVHAVRLETVSFWATNVDTDSELIVAVFAVMVEPDNVLYCRNVI